VAFRNDNGGDGWLGIDRNKTGVVRTKLFLQIYLFKLNFNFFAVTRARKIFSDVNLNNHIDIHNGHNKINS
jgi:hypothetical protein